MAWIAPTSTTKASLGRFHLYCFKFPPSADNGDMYRSEIRNVVSWWVSQASNGSGAGVSASETNGIFTLGIPQANTAVHLFVVAKG